MEIGTNPRKKIPWEGDEHVFVSSLFQADNKYVTGPMRLKYDPIDKKAVITFRGTNYSYRLEELDDTRKLIPILLLAK